MMTVKVTLYCDEPDCDGSTEVTGRLRKDGSVDVDAPNGWKPILEHQNHDQPLRLSCPRSHR